MGKLICVFEAAIFLIIWLVLVICTLVIYKKPKGSMECIEMTECPNCGAAYGELTCSGGYCPPGEQIDGSVFIEE